MRAELARRGAGHARPRNYRLVPEEAAYIVDDSDAVVACVDAEYAPLFAAIRPSIPKVRAIVVFGGDLPAGMLDGDVFVAAASDAEPPPPSRVDVPTSMLYTSGTTGRPKGAVRLYDDEGSEIAEPGVPGEVFVRTAGALVGYYKADDKFRAARRDDGFISVGDIAYRDAEGFYYLCDRRTT